MDDRFPVPQTQPQLAAAAADSYYKALATWLEGKPPNTRRSYFYAVRAFLNFRASTRGRSGRWTWRPGRKR